MEIRHEEQIVKVHVSHDPGHELTCPQCGRVCKGYDHRPREWRHLDTCQYQTTLAAEVPWAEPLLRFTMLFESLAIEWLKEASTSSVARLMGLSWNAIEGIMQRAVARGLWRREVEIFGHIGVDETSFRKRHDYVTVVSE